MQHFTSSKFEKSAAALPARIQGKIKKSFAQLNQNPNYPSLQFKKMDDLYSIRVTISYRALAYKEGDDYIWFWVGEHDEYDKIINRK